MPDLFLLKLSRTSTLKTCFDHLWCHEFAGVFLVDKGGRSGKGVGVGAWIASSPSISFV